MISLLFHSIQVQLGVYYESLCPDSVRFIIEQLHPVKSGPLGRYIDVTLIPFGKASVSIGNEMHLYMHQFLIEILANQKLQTNRMHFGKRFIGWHWQSNERCICVVFGFTINENYRYAKDKQLFITLAFSLPL